MLAILFPRLNHSTLKGIQCLSTKASFLTVNGLFRVQCSYIFSGGRGKISNLPIKRISSKYIEINQPCLRHLAFLMVFLHKPHKSLWNSSSFQLSFNITFLLSSAGN